MSSEILLRNFGYRFGSNGAHSARTMMFRDISILFADQPEVATKAEYRKAIIDSNVLGKPSRKSRELAFRHLVELFGLSPELAVFRVFRWLWQCEPQARPVLALSMSLVRDPLLRRTQSFMLAKEPGEIVKREEIEDLISRDDPDRYSCASRKSFAQNINGTWTQAGYLYGHSRKLRVLPNISCGNVIFSLFLGYLEGLSGKLLFSSNWIKLLASTPDVIEQFASQASQRGLIIFLNSGGIQDVRFPNFLTADEEGMRLEVLNGI